MSHQRINLFKRRLANFSIQQKIKNAVAHQKKLEFQIRAERSIDSPLLLEQETTTKQIKLGFISGLVSREKSVTLEKNSISCYGGNVFLKQSNRPWLNILFLIFCQGEGFRKTCRIGDSMQDCFIGALYCRQLDITMSRGAFSFVSF